MIMTLSHNGSCNPSRGGSPVRRGGSRQNEAYTRIFNISVRFPVLFHIRGYPIPPDLTSCLFPRLMNSAALHFALSVSANSRNRFVQISSVHLIILFAASLKTHSQHR